MSPSIFFIDFPIYTKSCTFSKDLFLPLTPATPLHAKNSSLLFGFLVDFCLMQ